MDHLLFYLVDVRPTWQAVHARGNTLRRPNHASVRFVATLLFAAIVSVVAPLKASAGGGPLGIDHRLSLDNDGIWLRQTQQALMIGVAATVAAGALWEGGDTRLGKTYWQSVDSIVMGAVASEGLKFAFSRERPANTDDPNRWFSGHSNASFPSGEVTMMAAAVTPFVLEYGREYPAVYALELLPIYDAIARMKVQAHWQTDVLAGFALGTAVGYFSHSFQTPLILGVLPHGFSVGVKTKF